MTSLTRILEKDNVKYVVEIELEHLGVQCWCFLTTVKWVRQSVGYLVCCPHFLRQL